jgi:hypothetical protein
MYDCEGYGGEFEFVYYELPELEPLEYTGIEPPETVTTKVSVDRGLMRFPVNDYPSMPKPDSTVRG